MTASTRTSRSAPWRSASAPRGIGVVPPVDPNNQDTSVLIGSEDISKLDRFSEGDPACCSTQRRLQRRQSRHGGVHRGLQERDRVSPHHDHRDPGEVRPRPAGHGTIYVDTCIVAHSNEAEWQKFKADHTNEAILDRIVVVKVPYNLRLSEEVKIYRKFLDRSKFNAQIAPHTLEIASMFAILSPGADAQVRSDDQAQDLQRRGGAGEGSARSSPSTSCARTPSARACSASAPASS